MRFRFALVVLFVFMLHEAGCGRWPIQRRVSPPPVADEVEGIRRVNVDPPPEYDYRIGQGDGVLVRFFYYPDMLEPNIVVPSDGFIQMPLIGPVQVIGLTERELNVLLREKYAERLKFPELVARIGSRNHDDVFLDGAVSRGAGNIPFSNSLTLLEVLKRGGMGTGGSMRSIVVIRGLNSPQYQCFRVDARKILDGKENDIYLQPNDIVYVPTKFITDVNSFVNRYIDRVLGQHIMPAQIFPQPYPYKGVVDYTVDVNLPTEGTQE